MENLVGSFYWAVFRRSECRDGFEDVCCRGRLDVLSGGSFDSLSGRGSFSSGRVSSSMGPARGRSLRRGSSIASQSGLDGFVVTIIGYEIAVEDIALETECDWLLTESRIGIPQHYPAKRGELCLSILGKSGKGAGINISLASCISRAGSTNIDLDVFVGRLCLCPVVPGGKVVVGRMVETTEVVI